MADDPKTEAEKQQRFDVKRARAWQEMMRTDGWKLYQEFLTDRINEGMTGIFDRPTDQSIRAQDFDRGRCAGLLYARDLPSVTIAAFEKDTSDSASEETER